MTELELKLRPKTFALRTLMLIDLLPETRLGRALAARNPKLRIEQRKFKAP